MSSSLISFDAPKISASKGYSKRDVELAKSNLILLCAKEALDKGRHTAYALPCAIACFVAFNYQRFTAYQAMGKPDSKVEEWILRPYLNPFTFCLPIPIIGTAIAKSQVIATLMGVARNSYQKLQNFSKRELSDNIDAVALHAFNLSAQTYFLSSTLQGIDKMHKLVSELLKQGLIVFL